MTTVRVLVIEDSLTVRKRIIEILSADPAIEVVGEAEDGRRGIELCEALRPDVVTIDMVLPVMSGLAATEYIMAFCPTPILIVSASVNRGELFKTYDALAAGAVDVLEKPGGDEFDDAWEQKLLSTVKLVARIKVITHLRARIGHKAAFTPPPVPIEPPAHRAPRVIAIGVSTGGPGALVQILKGLGEDFPIPIVLVIHLGKLFASAFAEWLDSQSPIPVTYARHGATLPPVGTTGVFMAPPDHHLLVSKGRFVLTQDAEVHSCRPSVDVLFASLAAELGPGCTACLLTGMGKDGAEGLLAVRRAGGTTIAQDESTSVVFGMPREAILLGAAERVLPLDRIGPALAQMGRRGSTEVQR